MRLLNVILLLLLVSEPLSSLAEKTKDRKDSISEVQNSELKSEFDKVSGKLQRETNKKSIWIDPKSNFSEIWKSQKSPKLLAEWLLSNLNGYYRVSDKTRKESEYAFSSTNFLSHSGSEKLSVFIIVPHPRSASAAKFLLIPQFAELRPPKLKATESSTTVIQGRPADFYRTSLSECVYVISLAREAVLSLSSNQCQDPKRLETLARTLDIVRLNRKLES